MHTALTTCDFWSLWLNTFHSGGLFGEHIRRTKFQFGKNHDLFTKLVCIQKHIPHMVEGTAWMGTAWVVYLALLTTFNGLIGGLSPFKTGFKRPFEKE
jgi:hypothetical protein